MSQLEDTCIFKFSMKCDIPSWWTKLFTHIYASVTQTRV